MNIRLIANTAGYILWVEAGFLLLPLIVFIVVIIIIRLIYKQYKRFYSRLPKNRTRYVK